MARAEYGKGAHSWALLQADQTWGQLSRLKESDGQSSESKEGAESTGWSMQGMGEKMAEALERIRQLRPDLSNERNL